MKSLNILGLALAAGFLVMGGVQAQENGTNVQIPADQIHFQGTGIIQHGGEIQFANAFGDLVGGQHGSFLKFPAKWASLLHSHTSDYYAVVVKGVMANPEKGEEDVPLPVGSYWYQKGGEPHTTKCLSEEECVMFIVQNEKFDAQVLEKE